MNAKLRKLRPGFFGESKNPLKTARFWAIVFVPTIIVLSAAVLIFYFWPSGSGSSIYTKWWDAEEEVEYYIYNGDKSQNSADIITIEVPKNHPDDGLEIREIGANCFKDFSFVKTIILPSTINKIHDNAFNGCKALEIVNIPDGAVLQGGFIFMDCESLTEITLPASVESLGTDTFKNCKNLTKITFNYTGVVSAIEAIFNGCTSLAEIWVKSGQYWDDPMWTWALAENLLRF